MLVTMRLRSLVVLWITAQASLGACRGPEALRLAGEPGTGPRILCVTAHPDDEIAFAGTLYKTATFLGGRCDVVVITNGEGGFKYATLAEALYGLELTDEAVGRARLPAIRRRELLAACKLLGVHSVRFLDERDHRYTQDVLEVLDPEADVWNVEHVQETLVDVMERGDYDFVFVLAPTEETHGHHKAAAILAQRAVQRLPSDRRPAILCARTGPANEPAPAFVTLDGWPETMPAAAAPFSFDRRQRFGFREQLDYRIVVNWAIAEHRSQGTLQLLMNADDVEHYYLLAASPPGATQAARELFEALRAPQFEPRSYDSSAGTNAGARR